MSGSSASTSRPENRRPNPGPSSLLGRFLSTRPTEELAEPRNRIRNRKTSVDRIRNIFQKRVNTITSIHNWRMITFKQKDISKPDIIVKEPDVKINVTSDISATVSAKLGDDTENSESTEGHQPKADVAVSPGTETMERTSAIIGLEGRGILKKVSTAEAFPVAEVETAAPLGAEEVCGALLTSSTATNNSPNRMVKFNMPSFDSHTSDELSIVSVRTFSDKATDTADDVAAEQDADETDSNVSRCVISDEITGKLVIGSVQQQKEEEQAYMLSTLLSEAAADLVVESDTEPELQEVRDTEHVARLAGARSKWINLMRQALKNLLLIDRSLRTSKIKLSERNCDNVEDKGPVSEMSVLDGDMAIRMSPAGEQQHGHAAEPDHSQSEQSATSAPAACLPAGSLSCPNIWLEAQQPETGDTTGSRESLWTVDPDLLNFCPSWRESHIIDDFVIL